MSLTIYYDDRQLRKYLGSAAKRWPEASGRALQKVGDAIFAQSQAEVPKGPTGRLESSTFRSITPKTYTISYTAPYARIVHFRKARHKEGKRKFVTGPLGKGKRILGYEIQAAVEEEIDRMGANG